MNDKLRQDLDEQAERINPSHQVSFPNAPDLDQLVREADEHIDQAVVHYRDALGRHALGQPATHELLRTVIEQQAASLAQERVLLLLMARILGADLQHEEPEEALPS